MGFKTGRGGGGGVFFVHLLADSFYADKIVWGRVKVINKPICYSFQLGVMLKNLDFRFLCYSSSYFNYISSYKNFHESITILSTRKVCVGGGRWF